MRQLEHAEVRQVHVGVAVEACLGAAWRAKRRRVIRAIETGLEYWGILEVY